MFHTITAACMGLLFYRMPQPVFSDEEVTEYEQLYSLAAENGTEIIYNSSYPKARFLQYIALTKPVVMHGSNHKGIAEFETRRQTLFNGKDADAVFATKDGSWASFYAVFDRTKLAGNFRNACFTVWKDKHRYYFFSLTQETLDQNPWTSGMVYILPQAPFQRAGSSIVAFDEWISMHPVTPVTRLEVRPQDFCFQDKVACHRPQEPVLKSWLWYKRRVRQRAAADPNPKR